MEVNIFIGIGVLSSLVGLLLLLVNKGWIDKLVRYNNDMRGIKTEITPRSADYFRLMGVVVLILGLLIIAWGWFASTLPVIPSPGR